MPSKKNNFTPNALSLGDVFLLKNEDRDSGNNGDFYPKKLYSDGYPYPNFMFFGGGYGSGSLRNIQRLDAANDTTRLIRSGIFSYPKSECGGAGNANYGWWIGGRQPAVGGVGAVSNVQRLDFSNDLEGTTSRGALDAAMRCINAGAGNVNYGWRFGGYDGGYRSTTSRIDYAADLFAGSARGNLAFARASGAATGNSTYGWHTGGETFPTYYSFIDRMTYASDLSAGSPRTNMTFIRSNHAAVCDGTYLWTGGGNNYTTEYSSVDRTTLASDLSAASTRCNLSGNALNGTGCKNATYTWWLGSGAPAYSSVDRMTFASDLTTSQRFTSTIYFGPGSPNHDAFNA